VADSTARQQKNKLRHKRKRYRLKKMLFLTVGTQFPFERLVKEIDRMAEDGLINDKIFAQTGVTQYKPINFEWSAFLSQSRFEKVVLESEGIIAHSGIGTIALAMEHQKPILVMPRMKKFNEHVNDHQVETARSFEKAGCILAAYDTEQLRTQITNLKSFVPVQRKNNSQAIITRISDFIKQQKRL
jgi:UDP-N-acetylglucosamine transferase subunit ALG13